MFFNVPRISYDQRPKQNLAVPFLRPPAGILSHGTAGKFRGDSKTIRLYGFVFTGEGSECGGGMGEGGGDYGMI